MATSVFGKGNCSLGNCLDLIVGVENNSIHSLVVDPPYGINFQGNQWDKALPNPLIWKECLRVLRPGSFGLVFSSIKLMHRMMINLEDSGFLIKDVLMWGFLNGMPKSRDVSLEIDKLVGVESEKIGEYKYVQGYKKGGADDYRKKKDKLRSTSLEAKPFLGCGLGIKPAYEPIILVQKPLECTVAENLLKWNVGALNLEETRIPYEEGESGVGHNPNPAGRVVSNILRTEPFGDGYDKFFLVPKVRQHKEDYNFHPTIKPINLMSLLVNLVSFKNQTVIDPFMGSGSTGVAAIVNNRNFIGFELDPNYYNIAYRRIMTDLCNDAKNNFR